MAYASKLNNIRFSRVTSNVKKPIKCSRNGSSNGVDRGWWSNFEMSNCNCYANNKKRYLHMFNLTEIRTLSKTSHNGRYYKFVKMVKIKKNNDKMAKNIQNVIEFVGLLLK